MADTINCNVWTPRRNYDEWSDRPKRPVRMRSWEGEEKLGFEDMWEMPTVAVRVATACEPQASVEACFRQLAADWSEDTLHISSISDLTSHPSYQEIIKLGWDVVPFLLADLQRNRGFWFTALHAITKIRPFDPSDAGNSRRMTDAWIKWGKRKGII